MTKRRIWLTVGALYLICGSMGFSIANAALRYKQQDIDNCNRFDDPDRQIMGCTHLIADRSGPAYVTALITRGNAWQNKEEHDRAIADYSEVIRLIGHDNRIKPRIVAGIYSSRATAWGGKGDYDRAIADFSEGIRIDPENAYSYSNRANMWIDKGEFDRAVADYNEALRIEPKSPFALSGRGNAWIEKKEFDRAIADYNEAVRLAPNLSYPYHNRANAWKATGGYDQAISDYNEAIRLNPKDAVAYGFRGEVWRLKGDLDQALVDQDQAVALAPKIPLPLISRGDTLRYKGEFARAIADYEKALGIRPDYTPALAGLGLTYEKMGDLASARTKFKQAVASESLKRFRDVEKSGLETARARLAALDSGVAQPAIPNSLPKATSATSIPTPVIGAPTAAPAIAQANAAKQGRRVALVIGNSAYKNVPALPNPQKDAEAIAASLRNIGFDSVMLLNDVTRDKLVEGLRAFADEADKAEWALVYYAGHGIEVGGQNYLIPIDAKLATDRDVQFEAIPLGQLLGVLQGAKKLKLILLDACRVNPFTPQMRMTEVVASASAGAGEAGTRSIGRGLGRVDVSTGPTLVVFAAKDGQTALDGDGSNSPFAIAMVQRIATPGVEINKLFRLVRDDVMEATAGRQEPYTYGSLPGSEDFFFVAK
jgi:tetratricopeptide (TPR) repeat protein